MSATNNLITNRGNAMRCLKITLYPIDFDAPFSLSDCVMSIAILSEEMGLGYRLNPSGATVEGKKSELLIFLRHLRNETFGKLADKVVMIVSFPGEDNFSRRTHGNETAGTWAEPRPSLTLEETVLDMIG